MCYPKVWFIFFYSLCCFFFLPGSLKTTSMLFYSSKLGSTHTGLGFSLMNLFFFFCCVTKSLKLLLHPSICPALGSKELDNSNLLSVDLEGQSGPIRLINIYRSFNPSGDRSANEMFNFQLNFINLAYTPTIIIVGDFNITHL